MIYKAFDEINGMDVRLFLLQHFKILEDLLEEHYPEFDFSQKISLSEYQKLSEKFIENILFEDITCRETLINNVLYFQNLSIDFLLRNFKIFSSQNFSLIVKYFFKKKYDKKYYLFFALSKFNMFSNLFKNFNINEFIRNKKDKVYFTYDQYLIYKLENKKIKFDDVHNKIIDDKILEEILSNNDNLDNFILDSTTEVIFECGIINEKFIKKHMYLLNNKKNKKAYYYFSKII